MGFPGAERTGPLEGIYDLEEAKRHAREADKKFDSFVTRLRRIEDIEFRD